MAQPTQTRKIFIKVDAPGAKEAIDNLAKSMGYLNKNTKSIADNMGFLSRSFQGFLGFLGVRELTRMSDEMQNLNNRLKTITGSTEGAQAALSQIAGVADRTNQSVANTGEVFSRLALSLRGAKATTQELSSLTEVLIDTFRLSGATTTETTNTIIQLSQAFSSGELRGQELRSVLEQNAVLANLLRERFGQDIFKKAQEGAIKVTDVLKLLAENQKKIIEDAKVLAPTFEQVLVKALDQVSLRIGKLNEEYKLSAKFALVLEVAINQLSNALIVLAGVAIARVLLALSGSGGLIAQLGKLFTTIGNFAKANPYILAFTAIATVTALVANNWETVTLVAKKLYLGILELAEGLLEHLLPAVIAVTGGRFTALASGIQATLKAVREEVKATKIEISELEEKRVKKPDQENDGAKDIQSLIEKLLSRGGVTEKLKKIKDILAEINKEFLRTGDIVAYQRAFEDFELEKVNREFEDGKFNAYEFHKRLRDINIERLNRQLYSGALSLGEFNRKVDDEKFKVLNEQVRAGVIGLQEYNAELLKLESKLGESSPIRVGTENYLKSIGTLGEQIAKGVEQAFGHLEDALFEFIKVGQFNFRKFTQAILDDLTRIILRALIIRPIAEGILGAFSAPSSGGGSGAGIASGSGTRTPIAQAAKGAAFEYGNVIPFARGGIVNSPTGFTFGGGRRGVMGEAGPEAILPLARAGNGNLGVQASVTPVTINIINQTGAGVQQTESTGPNGERQIDILISSKVKEGIATGKYDTVFRTAYGLSRKGS